MSPVSDWLEPDTTIVISEASLQGKKSHIPSHNSELHNNSITGYMGNYISVVSENVSNYYLKNQIYQNHTHT